LGLQRRIRLHASPAANVVPESGPLPEALAREAAAPLRIAPVDGTSPLSVPRQPPEQQRGHAERMRAGEREGDDLCQSRPGPASWRAGRHASRAHAIASRSASPPARVASGRSTRVAGHRARCFRSSRAMAVPAN